MPHAVFYTDGSKMQNASSVVFAPSLKRSELMIFDNIDHNTIIDESTISKNWNLGPEKSIKDAELYAIYQATRWAIKTVKKLAFDQKIWIFTDSQGVVKNIQKLLNLGIARDIRANIQKLTNCNYHLVLNWIPSHENIRGNEKADQIAKLGQNNPKIENLPITFDHLRNQIKQNIRGQWGENWRNSNTKGMHYSQFNTSPCGPKIKLLSKVNKITFATVMQLNLGHGYFRSYLNRLPAYNSAKCTGRCVEKQTPEHLLLHCMHHAREIQDMKRNIGQAVRILWDQ